MRRLNILTVQMFLLRAHDFVRGGLADCFGHGGARHAVLGCGDPVRDALPRHLRSLGATNDSYFEPERASRLVFVRLRVRAWGK